ncbi:MAG: hypothetical protein ACO1N1_18460 [Dyadobacter fermentans]
MKKSLLFFVVLALAYEVLVRNVDVWWTIGQNQWHTNRMVADDFLYGTEKYPSVMVGSSLAARLRGKIAKDSLPSDMCNLALSGQSAFDGLLILKQSGYVPKHLYIETNVIERSEDAGLQKALFLPVMAGIKTYLKSWRDSYQPMEVLVRYRPRKPSDTEILREAQPPRDERGYRTMLDIQLEKGSIPLDDKVLKGQIEKLKSLVTYFQQKGTHVTLFEMPIDPALCSIRKVSQIRNEVKKEFLPLGCDFIAVPDCNNYRTTDGVHLEIPSVYTYLRYFRNAIAKRS